MSRNAPHRVLLVEDDAALREMIASHLARGRYEVITAESAEDVLDRLRKGELSYDVCLLDLHLPKISGLELSRLLLATASLKPVILITGDDDQQTAGEALAQGVTGYLLKPFELFELDASLAQAISMLELVEATETLARAQAETLDDWGEAGGMLPRAWLHLGDERSGAGAGHGARVISVAGQLARALGSALDGPARDILRTAARTHEVGRLLGGGGTEVAARSAQLLDNLGFDRGVGEVVRDAAVRWSPGLPLSARILSLADRLDHDAVDRCRTMDPDEAIRRAVDAVLGGAGEATDPDLAVLLDRSRESVESMWILQRQERATAGAGS